MTPLQREFPVFGMIEDRCLVGIIVGDLLLAGTRGMA
jgi:hypothetical protein